MSYINFNLEVIMASVQKSMRIPKELVEEIQDIAQKSGKDFSTITKYLLEEAIKMHRCPGIAFTEGVSGRRARIAGTGIDVWEVIAHYNTVGQDLEHLSTIYHWLTELQLRAALAYYSSYSKEIDDLITQNENWNQESIQKRYPFLAASRE
jgi:uncharacterized protein (DUF433 family)